MNYYKATGRVYPLDSQITLEEINLRVNWRSRQLSLGFSIMKSRILVNVASPAMEDPHDLMIFCEDNVQGFLNCMAITLGIVCEAFIESLEDASGMTTRRELATPGIKLPERIDGALAAEVMTHFREAGGPLGHFIGMAFDDFRMAMRRPQDTAFHCFRAIECLRNYCAAKYKLGENKGAQWIKLREIAECTRDYLEPITSRSEEIRHGEFKGMDGGERNDILQRTRQVIGTFLKNEFRSQPPAT